MDEEIGRLPAARGALPELARGDLLLDAAGQFLEDRTGVAFHALDGTAFVARVQMPVPPPRVDRLCDSTTVSRVRARPALLLAALVLAAAPLTACTTERVVVIEREGAPESSTPSLPEVPVARLGVALQRFLAAALAGAPTDLLLAGDRFVVLTPVDILEITSLRARGDVRMVALGVPGPCAGECHALLGDVLAALRDDLGAAGSDTTLVRAESPLEEWPTLEVVSTDRRWRVSFDETGRNLFVIELLAGAVLP